MTISLLELPPELQAKIYNFCSKSDVLNLALCSKQICDTVIHLLWYEVKIKWKNLEKRKKLKGTKKYFKYIASLQLTEEPCSCPKDNIEKRRSHRSHNFKKIIKNADPLRLLSLHFNHYAPKDSFEVISQKLFALTDLNLLAIVCRNWKQLWGLKCLQKLLFTNCNVADEFFEGVMNLQDLLELQIFYCPNVTARSFHYIKQIDLSKLGYSYQNILSLHSEDSSIQNLSALVDLKYLRLESARIFDYFLTGVLTNLRNLTELDVSWNQFLTDSCMVAISELVLLQILNLSRCTDITDQGISYLSNLKLLKCLNISGCLSFTDKGLVYLSSITSLRIVDVRFCTSISYEQILAYAERFPKVKVISNKF